MAGDGQPQPTATIAAGVRHIGLREGAEEGLQLGGRHANTRVLYLENEPIACGGVFALGAEGDTAVGGELIGVLEEVVQNFKHFGLVGLHVAEVGGRFHHQRIACPSDGGGQCLLQFGQQIGGGKTLDVEGDTADFDARRIQNVANQLQQTRARIVDALQIRDKAGLVCFFRLFHQDFAVADDGVERGAQFVAHVGQEGAFGAVGCLGRFPRRLCLAKELGAFNGDGQLVGHRLGQIHIVGGKFVVACGHI